MEITDEIAEAAWCAFRDSDKPAPYNQVKDAIAAVAPLIAQEAAKEIEALQNNLDHVFGTVQLRAREIEAQAKEIAELRAALRNYAIHMEYDCPGDVPEECGWWCEQCKQHVEDDKITGHNPGCLCAG